MVFFLLSFSANATIYYVSNSGNDSNSGKTTSQAWKTLTKVNSFTPVPGDQILFKRGDSWNGTLIVKASGTSSSPIVYGTYGTGAKPVIYGSEKITGWTKYSGNIYKASVNIDDIKQLFLNDSRMILARYPDKGFFKITSVSSSAKFSSNDLNGGVNYSGATCILKNRLYTMFARNVTSSSSQTLTLSSTPVYPVTEGYGFWLTNKLNFLTKGGEWYYDNSANTLYFWTPNGDSPSNYEVRASHFDYGVKISGKNYITISDLEIEQSGIDGINSYNSDYLIVANCNIINPDLTGINHTGGSKNITTINNYISGANGRGITDINLNAIIKGNTIKETGQLENINKAIFESTLNFGTAIFSRNNNHVIEYNNIINTGYTGINFQGLNTKIKYNYINGACQSFDDGGGIYVFCGGKYPDNTITVGSQIENNIVLNVMGSTEGSDKTYSISTAIYLDNSAKGITVKNNTIAGASTGIYIKGGQNYATNNTIMDATLAIRGKDVYEKCGVYDNIIYQTSRIAAYAFWSTPDNQRFIRQNYAEMLFDNNIYISHYSTNRLFSNLETFSIWKALYGQDGNSTFQYNKFTNGETEELFYNNTQSSKSFDLGNTVYEDIFGEEVTGRITLQPYTSQILIKTKNTVNISEEAPSPSSGILGNTEVYNSTLTASYRRAIPVTFNEDGTINSISIYHEGGTGNVLLGVYSNSSGSPRSLLGETSSTSVNLNSGWQTVSLANPVNVVAGQTVWLSWIFQNPIGVRYTSGTPGRAQSTDTWASGLPDLFGSSGILNYKYSIYCSYTAGELPSTNTLGNEQVYSSVISSPYRLAMPFTINEDGIITSISIYHEGGTGDILLGVYSDQSGAPKTLLGMTPSTRINSSSGWQTVSLANPIDLTSGQTVWLSWVFQNPTGIRYTAGVPGRAQSSGTWTAGMPGSFGSSKLLNYKYSIYCTYFTNLSSLKGASVNDENKNTATAQSHANEETNQSAEMLSLNTDENSFDKNEFKLYPNPAKAFVNVDYSYLPETDTKIIIFDSNGRAMLNQLVDSKNNRIDISHLSNGIYYLKSTNQNNNNTLKFIISK